jgi:hypothetical protein
MKKEFKATVLLLAVAVAMGLAPRPIAAYGEHDEDRPIRLYASARFGPVGKISASSLVTQERATAIVNGRAASGEVALWGGEMVEAPRDKSVRVSFNDIGEVALSSGAMARFSTSVSGSADAGRNGLVATLIAGRLTIRLNEDASAYVEAAGTGYTASRGADFRVRITDEGRAAIEAETGVVTASVQTTPQGRYTLRPPQGQGASLSVSARSTRQIQIQVTDENDRPVPDLAILFSLGNPCLGALGIGAGAGTLLREKTDNRGIATIPWVVGATRCAGSILVRVEGTNSTFTYQASVRQPSFWSLRNSLIVGGIAAATTGVVVATTGGGSEPIKAVPPPQVRP